MIGLAFLLPLALAALRLATTSTATRTCLPSTRLLSRSLWLLLLHQDSLHSLSGNKALESERRPVLVPVLVLARRTARNRVVGKRKMRFYCKPPSYQPRCLPSRTRSLPPATRQSPTPTPGVAMAATNLGTQPLEER